MFQAGAVAFWPRVCLCHTDAAYPACHRFLLDLRLKTPSFLAMTILRNLLICSLILCLPSCALVRTLVTLPVGILKTAGRTVGLNTLTDAPAEPITEEQEKPAIGQDPVSSEAAAE